VVGFTWLGEAVIDGLVPGNALRGAQNQTALLRQGEKAAGTGFGMRDFLLCDKALADKVPYVRSGAVFVSVVGELLQILARNGAKLAKFGEGVNFGRAKPVGLPANFVSLSRVRRSLLR
jgi:hypothetical protein